MASFYSSKSGCTVSPNPAFSMVEMLTPIWESVLHQSSIGIDDNFFKLGGNQRAADLLFADIARKCDRELPSATIFCAPTIAALAAVLEQPTLPRFSPYVQLKAGTGKLPILIAHGLNGCASFSGLAESIPTEHPIYGIQARGVDGLEEPFDGIEDMAQFYIDALTDLPCQGPYILIGYSFGGLVALEMAHRLTGNQNQVGLLILIDAYPHPRYLSAAQRVRLGVQRVARHMSEMKQRPMRGAISYFMSGLKNRLRIAGVHRDELPPETSRLALARTTLHVKNRAYEAMARYRPLAYKGAIKFVKSESDTYFPGDPVPVWANLAASFEVETVPGTHLNMVTTHFESLAAVLTRYLGKAVR
jgi:acetoacetyl-CoA synthetase